MIPVTKTFLPPFENYVKYLQQIWQTNQLTYNGPLVCELECKLKEYLNVKHLFFVSNGTIALQIAIKALNLNNKIITTPFSYVATTSSIVWEGCQPLFVDIDQDTLCIDSNLIEQAITPATQAILATHVFGIPCNVEKIQEIADKHKIWVIYDAAHTFGARYNNKALVSFGDISTLSFHATKIFHTVEGGAIVTDNDDLAHRINYMRNFGHHGQEEFWGLGINGKNSELHAAMGLCNLSYVDEIIATRKEISRWYDELLEGAEIKKPLLPAGTVPNYAYYPVLFRSEEVLLAVKTRLNELDIYPRRYFYPSLNTLPYVGNLHFPKSENCAKTILCLPLYFDLSHNDVRKIVASLLFDRNRF